MLLDLRRKGIRVPPELQMKIIYLKEIAETRDNKRQVTEIMRQVPMCDVFQMPQSVWDGEWSTTCIRTALSTHGQCIRVPLVPKVFFANVDDWYESGNDSRNPPLGLFVR